MSVFTRARGNAQDNERELLVKPGSAIDWFSIPRPRSCLDALCGNRRVQRMVPTIRDIAKRVVDFCDGLAAVDDHNLLASEAHAVALCPSTHMWQGSGRGTELLATECGSVRAEGRTGNQTNMSRYSYASADEQEQVYQEAP